MKTVFVKEETSFSQDGSVCDNDDSLETSMTAMLSKFGIKKVVFNNQN